MSPDAECPNCHRIRAFHDDEMEDLEEGLTVCTECQMAVAINTVVGDILTGELEVPLDIDLEAEKGA
jgi:hypothetical protein